MWGNRLTAPPDDLIPFVAEIGRYVNQLDAFADEFSAILSRQLDEKVH